MKTWMVVVGIVAGVVLLGVMGGDGGGSSTDACREFRDAAADVRDGVATEAEFRQRLQTVREEARTSRPELREAATDLLAVVTDGEYSGARFDAAVRELGDQCRLDGH